MIIPHLRTQESNGRFQVIAINSDGLEVELLSVPMDMFKEPKR